MKRIYPLLTIVALTLGLGSCSSSRNTQSTDDIYYSSGRNTKAAAASSDDEKDEYYSTPDDNYVRMKAEDPDRWSYFDDYSAYDSYYYPTASMAYGGYGFYPSYGFGLGFGPSFGFWDPYMFWNSYFIWNSWYNPYFYNPYYGGAVLVTGHTSAASSVYSNLRPFNSTAYSNGLHSRATNTVSATRFYRSGMTTSNAYNNGLASRTTTTNSGRAVNNSYRPYNNSNNNNNSNYQRPSFNNQPTRSYTPSYSPSSAPVFRGGGGGGFSRPGH